MKKLVFLILLISLFLSGCTEVTQSRNTNLNDDSKEVEVNSNFNGETEEALDQPSEEVVAEDINQDVATEQTQDVKSQYTDSEYLNTQQEEMELSEIITKMKSIFNIDDSYDDIRTEEHTSESGFKTYNVNYNNLEKNESLWYSSDSYGNLINYGKHSEYLYSDDIPETISRSEAQEIVGDFLVKLYGDSSREYIINMPRSNNLDSYNYIFDITRTANGVKVPSDSINMEISKKDGSITSIMVQTNTNYNFADESYFESLENLKSEDEAFEKFKEFNILYKSLLGIERENPGLYADYEYKPIYSFLQNQVPVNAKTLEPEYSYSTRIITYSDGASEEMAADMSQVEQEHLDSVKDQHNVIEAEEKARQLFELGDYKLSQTNFTNYNRIKGYFVWELVFQKDEEYIYIKILANDLSLISYQTGNMVISQNKNEPNYNPQYLTDANNFLTIKGGLQPRDFTLTSRSVNEQYGPIHEFKYFRIFEDDLHIYNDQVYITIDKETQEVTGYSRIWSFVDEVEYKEFEISQKEGYEILNEQLNFDLVYKRESTSENSEVKLFYELSPINISNFANDILLDGTTGKLIDLYGKPLNIQRNIEYEDIDEAKNPDIIKTLAENGIGFPGRQLNPKEKINQVDLFRIFLSSYNYGTDPFDLTDDEVYQTIENMNLLEIESRQPDKLLTHRDYSRYISKLLNYNDIAKMNDIFKDKYDDITSEDSDYGYLFLGDIKGLIESEDNKLMPDKEIDRETALYYFYNLKLID